MALLSAAILLTLSIIKGIISFFSGSVALLADSVHSFADIFSSVAVWVGLRLVQRKPSERFPYGYYKAETFALFIVAVTIVVSGVLIILEAIERIFHLGAIEFPYLVLVAAAASGAVSYALGRYKARKGRVIGSQSLVGEGQHSLVDVYTSLIVFIGVSFSSIGYPIAEVLAGLAIGIYVIIVGLRYGKDAVLVLMDASLSPKQATELRQIAEGVQGVKGVHAIRLRKSGPVSFAEMHIEVLDDVPLEKAHAISEEVEERVKQRFKDLESINIHVGLAHRETVEVAIPITEDKRSESIAAAHFARAPFFAFVSVERGQIGKIYVKPNSAAKLTRKKGIETARFLIGEKVDIVLVGSIGEGPFHALRDSMVQIYILPAPIDVKKAISLLNENKLRKMTEPTENHQAHESLD